MATWDEIRDDASDIEDDESELKSCIDCLMSCETEADFAANLEDIIEAASIVENKARAAREALRAHKARDEWRHAR